MNRLILLMIVLMSTFISCKINNAGVHYARETDLQIPTDADGYTSEQRNVINRRQIIQNPSAIMWIYCLADTGNVVFYGPVKGKVTSSGKSIIVAGGDSSTFNDGTQGSSDEYVYWFDPSGKYFQWNGKYFLSTFEIKVNTAVINYRSVQ